MSTNKTSEVCNRNYKRRTDKIPDLASVTVIYKRHDKAAAAQ